jgi:3-oxoacyl-[acyl-carrier-protein] synthase II
MIQRAGHEHRRLDIRREIVVTKRIVVTGVGAVSPLGIGLKATWDGLLAGRSGIRKIQHWDASKLDVQIAGEVDGFVAKDHMDFKQAKRMDRFAQFGVAAAREALENSGLTIDASNADRVAVVVNTGGGGIPTIEHDVNMMHDRGQKFVSPLLIPLFAPNMASCQVSMAFGIHGPSITSAAACASGIQAFIDAYYMFQRDEADVILTGGTESGITPVAVAGLANMQALSKRNDDPAAASRPFDGERDGFVFSEGSAVFVLETEEHALARGADIIAEVHGGAYTSDAYHITAPHPEGKGAATAMTRAIKRAGFQPTDVDYIAAHATATLIGDVAETNALKTAFGDHARKLAISANKSMVGHLLGAAGAVSGLGCVMAIRDNIVHPTINLHTPDPKCDLDYVPNVKREMQVNVALANGFGFGGQNAVAVFSKYQG